MLAWCAVSLLVRLVRLVVCGFVAKLVVCGFVAKHIWLSGGYIGHHWVALGSIGYIGYIG